MGIPIMASTGLSDMPNEILLQIFQHLEEPSLASLLRLNKATSSIVHETFYRSLQLNERTLGRCPLAVDQHPQSYAEPGRSHNESRERAMINYNGCLKDLLIGLNQPPDNFEQSRLERLPFVSVSEEAGLLMRRQEFRFRMKTSLSCLFESLTSHPKCFTSDGLIRVPFCTLPIAASLTHVAFIARCEQAQVPWGPCNGEMRRVYLDQEDLLSLLQAVSHCTQIKELVVDTADAEETEWTPDHGIGPCCSRHVCDQFSKAMRNLARLERLSWRRRDVCPRFFDFALAHPKCDCEGGGEGPECWGAQLKQIDLDLRLPSSQRTGSNVWESLARHCQCRCWCTGCLKRRATQVSKDAIDSENQSATTDNTPEPKMVDQLSEAASAAAARLKKLEALQIWAYEDPSKPIRNWTRKPYVLDCIGHEKRYLD